MAQEGLTEIGEPVANGQTATGEPVNITTTQTGTGLVVKLSTTVITQSYSGSLSSNGSLVKSSFKSLTGVL